MFLIQCINTLGFGLNIWSCCSTSPTSSVCPRTFRAFMMRTIPASIANPRSSCTFPSVFFLSSRSGIGTELLIVLELKKIVTYNKLIR